MGEELPSGVNQCDRRCPAACIANYEHRLKSEGGGFADKLLRNTAHGLRGVRRLGRSAVTCPSRNLSESDWTPSSACVVEARQIAVSLRPLLASSLTDHELRVFLGAGIDLDAPPAEPSPET